MKADELFAGAMALGTAVALKAFYSHAGASELGWLLGPPCWLASTVGGLDLAAEDGAGYISRAHHLIVGPACAGLNFLVVCALSLFFAFAARFASLGRKLGWLAGCFVLAYAAAIGANATRIVVAAHLFELPLPPGWLTPERLHRLAGTVIYCAALALVHLGAETAFAEQRRRYAPFAWYLAITVVVPLVGRICSGGSPSLQLLEHALWVVAIAGVVLAARSVRVSA